MPNTNQNQPKATEQSDSSHASVRVQPSGPGTAIGLAEGTPQEMLGEVARSGLGARMAGTEPMLISSLIEEIRAERAQSDLRFARLEQWVGKLSKAGSEPMQAISDGESPGVNMVSEPGQF